MYAFNVFLKVYQYVSILYEVLRADHWKASSLGGSKSFSSVVVRISLQGVAVDHSIAFNDSGMLTFITHNRRSVEVDLVVDDEQRIVVVDNIVVHAHTVQVLLEQILEEEVLFLEGSLLLLDSKLVEMDLVETLVEIVEHLEFVLRIGIKSMDLLNLCLRFGLTVRVRLIEWQDFFLFGFKFPAEFSCLEDSAAKFLVISQCLHALKTVRGKSTKLRIFFFPLFCHLPFEVVIMLHDACLLLAKLIVTVLTFSVVLLSL